MLLVQHRITSIAAFGGSAAPPVTSYSNPGGQGDRTAIITVTWDGTTGGGAASDLVDGTTTNEFFWSAGQNSKTLKFDFGVGASKVIDEFIWKQDISISHGGSNKLEGSNDGSSWTTFPETFALGTGAAGAGQTVTITNSTGYRYYRITVPGSTSASPYLREIEFKIA